MKTITKAVTAILAAAMMFGSVLSVSANTLIEYPPAGEYDTISIVYEVNSNPTQYTLSYSGPTAGMASWNTQRVGNVETQTMTNNTNLPLDAYLDSFEYVRDANGEIARDDRGYPLTINWDTIVEYKLKAAAGSAAGGDSRPATHYYCTHDGASWINDNNATENSECTKSLVCPNCGAILSQTAVYGTAFLAFNNRVAEAVKAAPAGAEVIASTKRWNTVNADVLNAIDARDDVTVRFEYIRPNDGWTAITIPAGSDCAGLANEEGFAGFEYLIQQFGSEKIR